MPFAALVRRLSYTSSRLPAKYANRQHRENAYKRPKTSSGPLVSSPPPPSRFDDGREMGGTPIKTIVRDHSGVTYTEDNAPLSASGSSGKAALLPRPVAIPTTTARPRSRRRSKSGEAVLGAPKGSPKLRGKGDQRPSHPLRSISFMEDIVLKTSGNHRRTKAVTAGGDDRKGPLSPRVLAQVDPNIQPTSAMSSHLSAQQQQASEKGHYAVTPMTPDHEIMAALARHDFKRMSMPNLPTPPLSHTSTSAPGPYSPSIGLRTPSPSVELGGTAAKLPKRTGSRGEKKETKQQGFTPGWPWHRRNSSASLTSLLSPRLGRQASPSAVSPPSLSPAASVHSPSLPISSPASLMNVNKASSIVTIDESGVSPPSVESSFFRLDRTPSPNLPVRASSPLSQLSTPALEADTTSSPTSPESATGQTRPNVPRRSLSASFAMLGRKVASFGNNQAFEHGSHHDNEGEAKDGHRGRVSHNNENGSGVTRSTPSPRSRTSGLAPTPSPKTGVRGKEWPWRTHHSHAQSPSSPLSSASSPQDDVQWSFKVHGAYPAALPPASSTASPASPAASAQTKGLHPPRAHSPVFARSPLGFSAVQGDTYFLRTETTESPESSRSLSRTSRPASPSKTTAHQEDPVEQPSIGSEAHRPSASELLSPESAATAPAERGFVVESRPKLYRNARSDDGGLAARISADQQFDADAKVQNLSSSAPTSGRQDSSLISGLRSPSRQVSPSSSRNLTKIPEADEHDLLLQSRRESWLASLRGRPVASKRRMSAANIFGLPSPPLSNRDGMPVLPIPRSIDTVSGLESVSTHKEANEVLPNAASTPGDLDFSKRPIQAGQADHADRLVSSPRYKRASSHPVTPQPESQALRSRAVSQSSLLSASRPPTPGASMYPATSLTNIQPFPVLPTSAGQDYQAALLQRHFHRHTQSMPAVPQVDPAALQVTGLGAPESSVLAASQARFAKVLGGAAVQLTNPRTPAPTSAANSRTRQSVGQEDKEKMRRLMTESEAFEHAVDDAEEVEHDNGNEHSAGDQLPSPEMHRTPKLSYATSSSADSCPSTMEPRTGIRARILDMGTPVRAGSSSLAGLDSAPRELVLHRTSPSNRTSSSISNPNGPKNAFDILLSNRGLDSIDGLPQSRVANWARRDGSDDSEITVSSNATTDDGRPRDIFDEGRVSVW